MEKIRASQKDMKRTLELFAEDIAKAMKKDKKVKYISSASVGNYRTTIEMYIKFN